MDPKVEEVVNFVHSYAPNITEWMVLKKELLKSLPSSHRKLFSTRDSSTKKMNFNDFEKTVVEHWHKIAGVELYLEKP
jgi:hypothetical protein